MTGETEVVSIGLFGVTIAFVTDYSDFGISISGLPGVPWASVPVEGTISQNTTSFNPFSNQVQCE